MASLAPCPLLGLALALVLALARAQCVLDKPVDLGWTVSVNSVAAKLPFTPGQMTINQLGDNSYLDNHFCVGEHTGTHLDAPMHFHPGGWAVDQIPLDRLLANGAFLDASAEAAGNASFLLQPSHVEAWQRRNGAFEPNTLLLVSFGWARRHADPQRYTGSPTGGLAGAHFPGLSAEAAALLAGLSGVVGVGVDTPSIDAAGASDAHATLAARGCYNLENVNLAAHCLPGAFLDVSDDVVASSPQGGFRVTKEHLDKWVERNGAFLANTVLLIRFGWGQYYDNPWDYLGTQNERHGTSGNWPGVTAEAANHLVATGQIVGVGFDLPSIDPPNSGEIHVIFAAGNLYNLENLNLDAHCLPETGFKVHALPMNIPNATGAPVRVVAMPNYEFIIQKA